MHGLNNGVAVKQPSSSLAIAGFAQLPLSLNQPIVEPSECLLLKNMFDPANESEADFDLDIKEEVEEECSKFGPVKHIFVDKNSSGLVCLRFDSVGAAASCQRTMDKRWYAGKLISATFMRPNEG